MTQLQRTPAPFWTAWVKLPNWPPQSSKQVKELETVPFDAIHFQVGKGRPFRLELPEGNQNFDILLSNRDDPVNEFASQYNTSAAQGMVPAVGHTFVSSTPFCRPMATLIAYTVDYDQLTESTVPDAKHMFSGRGMRYSEGCTELTTGVADVDSCNSNLIKAGHNIGGDELMRAHHHGEVFCIFQPASWEVTGGAPVMKYWPGNGVFRSGDYNELVAQQDLTVVISSCPHGGQSSTANPLKNTRWLVAVKIYGTGPDLLTSNRSSQ